ncbi:unnamed protein product [Mesocestoides corti]|nr:unnamed protein product [Mesocestoides corti]
MRGRPYQRRYERSEYSGKLTYSYDAHAISTEIPKRFTTKSDPTFLDNKVPVENSSGFMEITDTLQAAECEAFDDDTLNENSTDFNPNAAYSPTKLPSDSLSTPSHEESHHKQSYPSASPTTSSSNITRAHFVAVNLLSRRSTSLGSLTLGFGVLQFLSIFYKLFI